MILGDLPSILTSKGFYIWRRLRFFFLRNIFLTILKVIEFSIIVSLLKPSISVTYIIARYLFEMISFYRWGNLEQLRQNLNRLHSVGGVQLVYSVIQKAWSQAIWVGYFILVIGLVIAASSFFVYSSFDKILWLIAGITLLQMGWLWILKALQSFVYSKKRIYRTTWSMILMDATPTIFIVYFARDMGIYALPLALLIEAFLKSFLAGFYAFKAYSSLKLGKLSWLPKWRGMSFKEMLHGHNYLFSEVMLLFILGSLVKIFFGLTRNPAKTEFAYICIPLIISVFSLRFIFYVDIIRYSSKVLKNVQKRVLDSLIVATVIWGLVIFVFVACFGAKTLGVQILNWHLVLGGIALLLWSLFLANLFIHFVQKEKWQINVLMILIMIASFLVQGPVTLWSYIILGPVLGLIALRFLHSKVSQDTILISSLDYLFHHFKKDQVCYEISFSREMNKSRIRQFLYSVGVEQSDPIYCSFLSGRKLLICGINDFPIEVVLKHASHHFLEWKEKKLIDYMKDNLTEVTLSWSLGDDFKGDLALLTNLIALVKGESHQKTFGQDRIMPVFKNQKLSGMEVVRLTSSASSDDVL